MVIEHRTEIGTQGNSATEIVYYSLYMHLSALGKLALPGQSTRRDIRAGDAIWRKDEIGTAGQMYGHSGQIHFEICLDAANLQRLIGRVPNWTEPVPAPTRDGRTNSIYGSSYFYLPDETVVDAGIRMPTHHLRRAAGAAGAVLGTAIWVKMTYERGACQFETFDVRGAPDRQARWRGRR